MSEAPVIPHETRQPFDLSAKLAARIDELGLAPHLEQLREQGYAIVSEVATPEFTTRLRDTCLQLAQETQSGAKGFSAEVAR